jgi:hypothetical protein
MGQALRVYAYASSFAFGVMDAEYIAAPWAVVSWDPRSQELLVEPLSDQLEDLGLQGVRPLSRDEGLSLQALWSESPGAARRLWNELNGVIASRIDRLERTAE